MQMPKFFKKKRNIIVGVILLIVIIVLVIVFRESGSKTSMQTGKVAKQNLQETVLSTGQVVSGTDLSLSFQSSGIVRQILVKEGDNVYQGQLLASLDQSSALATLTSAQGSLNQAQASYDKLINGATQSELLSLQDAVDLSKVNLSNTYNGASAILNNAQTAIFNAYTNVSNLKNNYFAITDQQGIIVQNNKNNINDKLLDVEKYIGQANGTAGIDLAVSNITDDLNSVFNSLQVIRAQCEETNYKSVVSAADKATLDTQKSAVSSSMTGVSSLQGSIASYKVAQQTAENNLSARKIKPRQEDIDLAKAQILSAQGQVDSAQAVVNNSIIRAPMAGTITQVDVKVGEQATPSKEVMFLQDVGDLHAEADVSEANVASLQVGQSVDYTFDALGPDQHFSGKVLTINPAATIISGVVDYKVTGSLDNVPNIKPGMTANMTILVAEKKDVLAVASTAIINKNSKQYVRIPDDKSDKTYHEVEVKTGLQADGGLVEITSGLNDGQEIIIYMK